jgi:hypothetical protein
VFALFGSSLLVDDRFVDKHDRDAVANRVEAMAGDAAEAGVVGFEFDFRPASRTDQDFEKFCADGQVDSLSFCLKHPGCQKPPGCRKRTRVWARCSFRFWSVARVGRVKYVSD